MAVIDSLPACPSKDDTPGFLKTLTLLATLVLGNECHFMQSVRLQENDIILVKLLLMLYETCRCREYWLETGFRRGKSMVQGLSGAD